MSEEESNKVPVQKKRGNPNAKTGLIGVYQNGEKYRAQVWIDGTLHYIGTFKTKEEAGIAYDRFVIDKSTEQVFFVLNYSYMTNQEREEVLVSHLFTTRKTEVNITISSRSLGITIDEQDGKAILTDMKVASSEQSGVCPEIKAANIPLGACLSFINGTKITTVPQAARIVRTSPRPVAVRFEFDTLASVPDLHDDDCSECAYGGDLLCCDYCNLVYHEGCLSTHAQPDKNESIKWACLACTKKEQQEQAQQHQQQQQQQHQQQQEEQQQQQQQETSSLSSSRSSVSSSPCTSSSAVAVNNGIISSTMKKADLVDFSFWQSTSSSNPFLAVCHNDDDDDIYSEQQHPYQVGQKIEVYYYEKGVTQRWFKATINAYHDDGIQIHWTVHDSLYKINNGEVESWIRLVGEDKEVQEKEYKEEKMPTYAKTVYQVDQEVEVYYPEQGVTQRWFKATIDAHLKGGIRINWNRHDTLYTVPNKRVASWIRHVGEDKELQESTSSCSSSSSSYTSSSSRAKRYTTNTRARSSSAIVAPQSPNGEHGQLGVASSKDQSSVSKKRKVDALESEERKEQHKKQRAHSDGVVKETDSTHSAASSLTTAGLDAVLGMSAAPSFTAATLSNRPAEVSMHAPTASCSTAASVSFISSSSSNVVSADMSPSGCGWCYRSNGQINCIHCVR
jgi:hypothetical protein